MTDRIITIDGIRYHADRPKSCRGCFFWQNRYRGCALGKDNCYYLAEAPNPSPCKKCPYGPCIGFCMRKVLGRKEVPANA